MTTNYVNNMQYAQSVMQTPDVSGVRIAIHQPTAGANPPAPVYAPYAYPQNYYLMPQVYYPPQTIATQPINQSVPQQTVQPAPQAIASQPVSKPAETNKNDINDVKETKKDKNTKKVIELTDDYIKSLENYLNSSDIQNREAGVVELMQRFEEEHSRKDDLALNNLLNKALQDPSPKIKMLACIICESDLAKGNAKTRELLTKIAQDKEFSGQLAETAKKGLLALSHNEVTIESNDVKAKKENK